MTQKQGLALECFPQGGNIGLSPSTHDPLLSLKPEVAEIYKSRVVRDTRMGSYRGLPSPEGVVQGVSALRDKWLCAQKETPDLKHAQNETPVRGLAIRRLQIETNSNM